MRPIVIVIELRNRKYFSVKKLHLIIKTFEFQGNNYNRLNYEWPFVFAKKIILFSWIIFSCISLILHYSYEKDVAYLRQLNKLSSTVIINCQFLLFNHMPNTLLLPTFYWTSANLQECCTFDIFVAFKLNDHDFKRQIYWHTNHWKCYVEKSID